MSIDCPLQQASLKRSSSAPMINEITSTMSIASPSTSAPPMYVYQVFLLYPLCRSKLHFRLSKTTENDMIPGKQWHPLMYFQMHSVQEDLVPV